MSWPTTPAYIFGRYLDVLAANPLASALAPWFTPGENLVRGAFLDPRRRELRPDWERSLGGRSPPCGPTSVLTSTIRG